MPIKKTLNLSQEMYEEFIKIKGELTAKFGLNLGDNFTMKALILNWKGDSGDIEEEAAKLRAVKTAKNVEDL